MLAATAAIPVEAVAQTPPEQELKTARDDLRTFSQALAKVPLPMSTEPAFRFKP
jgi:hypothetical protein